MQQNNLRNLAVIAIAAVIFGMGGGYLESQIFSPTPTPIEKTSPQTEKQTNMVLPENAVINVADDFRDSVVSIIGEKDVEYVMNNPRSFFLNDPLFDQFFNNNIPGSDNSDIQQPQTQKQKKQIAAGTGFLVSADGLILTNKHVVSDATAQYTVFFADDKKYTAEVVSRDPTNDLAILKIKDAGDAKFKPVKLVSSQNNVKIGQFVVAIGNALGQFDNTVTLGVISATGRSIAAGDGSGSSENLSQLLQTDAAINPGNSGGPLVNLRGEVVGINTAVAGSAQGIGFALPLDSSKIEKILGQIKQYGKIVKPYLGVRYQLITPELNKASKLGSDTGAWIHGENDLPAVLPDTPASKADLRGGDIVLKVDGKEVNKDNLLADILNTYSPDDTVSFEILRDGKNQTIKVTLGEWKDEETTQTQQQQQ